MKKITSMIALLLVMGIMDTHAGNSVPNRCTTPVAQENNLRNALWFNTQNRAGLAFRPMEEYNFLNLKYNLENGSLRPQTEAVTSHDISLNTQGAVKLGKFMIWGDFSFRNIFDRKAMFNTALYEVSEDMPFFIMDAQESNWNKQEYDLAASLTSPVVANRISFGLKIHYLTKVGAKQKDPRSETYKYNVEIVPSIAINLGKNHFLGLHGMFDNNFERSKPSLNNYGQNQEVVYNKGFGEGIIGVVGGNGGVKTLYYKGMRYGGGFQYSYYSSTAVLADFGYKVKTVQGFENPTLPYRLGSVKGSEITGDLQVLFGNNKSNRFRLNGLYSKTKGLEYIQKKNEEAFKQRWEVLKVNSMSYFQNVHACLSYDHLFGNDDQRGYDWKVGAETAFSLTNNGYRHPESIFTAVNLDVDFFGGKQFKFKTSTLLIALDLGYRLNIGGGYKYSGNKVNSMQVAYYTAENAYLNASFLKTGGRMAWTYNARKVNWVIDLKADWHKPLIIKEDRLLCEASIGIVF